MLINNYASEQGHWYYTNGDPAYTIIGANGKERATNVKDARKLGLVPSVTTILKLIPKPFLERWIVKQAVLSSLTLPRNLNETDDDYVERILIDKDEQSRKAKEKGSAIHGAIEQYLRDKSRENPYRHYAIFTIAELQKYLQIPDFTNDCESERSFATHDFGGKVDLYSIKRNFIIDFKTKDFDESTKKLAYDEQSIQLVAYARGLGIPTARLLNVFISTKVEGLVKIVEHTENKEYYWNVFKKCLALWQMLNLERG